MKLSQHTYPGTLITDPTAGCGSVMPHMRVHCLCYGLLSPIWSIVKPLGPMSASTASFSGLSSDSILLFRPYLWILPSLTFSSLLFISYSLDAVAATSTIHCVFSLRSVRLPGVWDINHTLLLLSTVSSRLYVWFLYSFALNVTDIFDSSPIYTRHGAITACRPRHIPERWLLIQPIFTNLHREFHALIWPAFTGLEYKRDSRPLNNGNSSANDLDPAYDRPLCLITDNTASFGILSSDWTLLI